MGDSSKTIIKVVVLAGAALGIYYWLQTSGLWQQWFGAVAPAQPNPNPLLPPGTPATTTTQTTAAMPDSYNQAAAHMTTTAGTATQNFDQWSWWWQNNPVFTGAPAGYGTPGSISGNMIDAMIAAGGGNRAALITAQQWVQGLYAQQQKGISGFGLGYFGPVAAQAYGWVN